MKSHLIIVLSAFNENHPYSKYKEHQARIQINFAGFLFAQEPANQ